ncbi:hypothetical protein NZK32_09840 [Cyanobium sp. FGCU-52]|nr:hypothetical protein [Cyanobium sp. FGCU52]
MNDDDTQGASEPSPASAGSQPVAWAVVGRGIVRGVYADRAYALESQSRHACDTQVIRMISLTDKERFLIECAAEEWEEHAQHWGDNDERVSAESASSAATLRGLLKRMDAGCGGATRPLDRQKTGGSY